MTELIDKGALEELFEEKMFNSESMCPVVKITDVLEIVEEQPTTTEAEIRTKAIEEFAEKLKQKSVWTVNGWSVPNVVIAETAEKLKEEQ